MRVLFTIAVLAFGIAGIGAADAYYYSRHHLAPADRAGMVLIYDDEPGVTIRPYWRAPWRQHHYFPASGKRPRIGRHENLTARSHALKPAKTFKRGWSNDWAFEHERVRVVPLAAPPRHETPVPELK